VRGVKKRKQLDNPGLPRNRVLKELVFDQSPSQYSFLTQM